MENYIIANQTDIGKARQVNEDNMITFDSPNGRVVAVCDGMGGQAAGDVASQLACDIIRDILENNTFANPNEAITKAILAANQAVLHRASVSPELQGMGSTCVMLIIRDGRVYYGWVGDSRIYYISNHTIRQISCDQSYVQMLVDTGQITPEEAENHPQKNEITNAIGVEGMTPPELGPAPIIPENNSVFLLCSDGLSGMVTDKQIEHIVSKTGISLQDKTNLLVNLANQQGGLDNITVQLVQFGNASTMRNGGTQVEGEAVNPKPKKGNGRIYTILAALVILAIAVGAYFYIDSEKKAEQKSKPIETEKVTSPESKKQQQQQQQQQTEPKKEQKVDAPKTDNKHNPPINKVKAKDKGKDALKDKINKGNEGGESTIEVIKEDLSKDKDGGTL